jgi:hypothetical protein
MASSLPHDTCPTNLVIMDSIMLILLSDEENCNCPCYVIVLIFYIAFVTTKSNKSPHVNNNIEDEIRQRGVLYLSNEVFTPFAYGCVMGKQQRATICNYAALLLSDGN